MRAIFLMQNLAGEWFVRTGSANGQKVSTNEAYYSKSNAVRAFITEGRNQPYAHMIVIVDGQKPMTVRAGRHLPEPIREADDIQRARISAALAFRKG